MTSGIVLRGQQAIIRRLRNARREFSTIIRDVHIGEFMEKRIIERFDDGVDPHNKAWPALDEETVKRKQRGGYDPDRMLYREGTLRDSIQQIVGRSDGIYAINTGLGFRIGISDEAASEYGRVHNLGLYSGRIHKRALVRKFLGVSDLDARAARAMLRRRVQTILGG